MNEGLNQFRKGEAPHTCQVYLPDTLVYVACNLILFITPVVNTIPSLRDLHYYITPQYAVQWKAIGTQLGLPTGTLDIIEHDNHYKARECCNAMLKEWLQVDTTASWEKLFTVIESPAVSCSAPDKGD